MSEKLMENWEQTLATYVYNHCNICSIPIHFCNIYMKHLQHTSETYEILETYACNVRFQRNISMLLGRMEECTHVEFTGGSGLGQGAEKMTPTSSSRR